MGKLIEKRQWLYRLCSRPHSYESVIFFRIFGIHSFYAAATLLNIWICMQWTDAADGGCGGNLDFALDACSSTVSRVSRMLHLVFIMLQRNKENKVHNSTVLPSPPVHPSNVIVSVACRLSSTQSTLHRQIKETKSGNVVCRCIVDLISENFSHNYVSPQLQQQSLLQTTHL